MMRYPSFDAVYALLRQAFPPWELRTREGQRALLSNPRYRLLWEESGGVLTGILALWELDSCRFIEHLAAELHLRGQGVGRRLMRRALESAEGRPVVLEVKSPRGDPDDLRRIRFYEGLGLRLTPCGYLQPPFVPGFDTLPLRVMSYPKVVGQEDFPPFWQEISREIYGLPEPPAL